MDPKLDFKNNISLWDIIQNTIVRGGGKTVGDI